MVKRGAPHRFAGAAMKKGRKAADPVAAKCREVTEAIREISSLDDAVKGMLVDLVPFSLAVQEQDRHEFQTRIVEIVAAELDKEEKNLEATLQGFTEKVGSLGNDRVTRELAVATAEAALKDQEVALAEKKNALASDCLAFRAARTAHTESQAKQTAGDQELLAAVGKKERLKEALEGSLKPLKEGSAGTPETLRQANDLVGVLNQLFPVTDILATVLPAALSKEPSARSHFDELAVGEVETAIEKEMQELDTLIEGGAQGKTERAEAVSAAAEAFEAAKKQQHAAAEAWRATDAERQKCDTEVKNAKKSLKDLAPEQRHAAKALENAQNQLEAFRQVPRAAFEELKNRRPAENPAEEEDCQEGEGSGSATAGAEEPAGDE